MTTQESLLALARAVYPQDAWYFAGKFSDVISNQGGKVFDPANNDAQAMEVLCWLLETNHNGKQIAATVNSVRCSTYDEDGEDILCWNEWHKNTPASLRSSIVQAACRLVTG